MQRVMRMLAVVMGLGLVGSTAQAAPIDLSTWTALTLDFPAGQGAGNWVLEPGNTAVQQTVNADPSFFLNNLNQTNYRIEGSWQVLAGAGDDDYMGFAFGYQDSANFYLFDWKQTSQNSGGRTASEGMTIKKFDAAGTDGETDLSINEFWENTVSFGDMTVLARNQSSTSGWVDNVLYNFLLEYNLTAGQFRVVVGQGATTLWDVTVADSTFGAGQFAFFNNSQARVRYAGFEQELNPPPPAMPEPGSLALLGAAAAAFALRRRRAAVAR